MSDELHPHHSLSWFQWCALSVAAASALFVGHLAARLAGFPHYPGAQGVLIQQPLPLSVLALVAMIPVTLIAARVAMALTHPLDTRIGAAIGVLAIAGFSVRGGSMQSVMLASDGSEVFWLLALETALVGALAWGVFALRRFLSGPQATLPGTSPDLAAAAVQLVLFCLLMLILGRSLDKGQAVGAVLASGVLASVLTRLVIGRVWTHGWSVPIVGGVLGFAANGLTAANVDIALLTSPAAGLAAAMPLEYVALGPAGILLGELLHGQEETEPIVNKAAT